MRMITTKDLEEMAEQVNVAFKRSDKKIAALEAELKVLKEFVNSQAKTKATKKA